MTLARFLRDGHTHHPEKTALIFAEHAWTYAEVDILTDRLATNLLAQGLEPGDRVALHMSNCPELVFSYYIGCFKVGAILEGSVRKAGNRLASPRSSSMSQLGDGFHLWSERYDRDTDDVFAVQDDIARSVVEKLKVKLLGEAGESVVRPQTGNLEAYHCFLAQGTPLPLQSKRRTEGCGVLRTGRQS